MVHAGEGRCSNHLNHICIHLTQMHARDKGLHMVDVVALIRFDNAACFPG